MCFFRGFLFVVSSHLTLEGVKRNVVVSSCLATTLLRYMSGGLPKPDIIIIIFGWVLHEAV